MGLTVRFYAELVELSRRRELTLPDGPLRSVKDVVESLGVPHPEVGLLLLDERPVGFSHRIGGCADAGHDRRLAVYPPWRTLPLPASATPGPELSDPTRFVLDVHLGALARRLRWLGMDCWYARDADDAELARVAVDQARILLTRDRGLLCRRVVVHGYLPRADDPDAQTLEVADRYGLSRHLDPGSRCVHCNEPLASVGLDEVVEVVPPRSRAAFEVFARCRGCGRVFWPGSHHDALQELLSQVRAAGRDQGP